jgi:hypothetical protein
VGDAVPFSPPGFEQELQKPFAESFELLGRYAEDIAARLRAQYATSPGYVITIHKETNPRFPCWEVKLHRGLFAGARVTIQPSPTMADRAVVGVTWHSRLFDSLQKVLGAVNGVIVILAFIVFKIFTHLIFTLIGTFIVGAVSVLMSVLVGLIFAKKCWDWFGGKFDDQRLATLAKEIKPIPLPSRTN